MKPMTEIKPAAKRLFQSRDGELVLEYLLGRYYHNSIKNETLARQVGQRDVMVTIRRLLEDTE